MDFFSRYSQPAAEPGSLITFYEDASTDSRGRRLTDILRWGPDRLESSHDYIQTLFPLPERSGVNDAAPIINRQVFEAFRTRPELRSRLRDAFKKMLWFYGFELHTSNDGNEVVKKGHNYDLHCENWLTRFDHNHLRITRIIRSLRVLGLEDEALAFYNAISGATIVSSRSRMYWGRATYRPLNIRPDVDDEGADDERIGPKFLREFEQARRQRELKHKAKEVVQDGEAVGYIESHKKESEQAEGELEKEQTVQDAIKDGDAVRNAEKAEGPDTETEGHEAKIEEITRNK